jgi:hypothetical protein
MSAQATFWLESQIGNQRLARQLQTEPSAWPVLTKIVHGPGRIDECNVTHSQFRDPIVLNHR